MKVAVTFIIALTCFCLAVVNLVASAAVASSQIESINGNDKDPIFDSRMPTGGRREQRDLGAACERLLEDAKRKCAQAGQDFSNDYTCRQASNLANTVCSAVYDASMAIINNSRGPNLVS